MPAFQSVMLTICVNFLQIVFSMLADGTMANEVELCHSLLQWPYLTDMSLVNAVVSIFQPGWCTGPQPLVNTLLLKANPWFYFNLVLRESQVGDCVSGLDQDNPTTVWIWNPFPVLV